jgi:sugar lactone lactonase YvrE
MKMVEAMAMSMLPRRSGIGIAFAFLALAGCLSGYAQSAPPNGVQATSTPVLRPHGVAYDASGNYYIAATDQNVIRKVSRAGIITTVAGTGEQGYAGDGGPATAALLDSPGGVAVDSTGNIYIADTHNNVIRKVLALNGSIVTIAGTGFAGFSGDSSTATSAELNYPTAVAVDSTGNVYVADTNNHRIRKIIGTNIYTVAGNGEQGYAGDTGPATAASLDSPNGVAVDAAFNLYIGDTHNQLVRVVAWATGYISTLAGTGVKGYNGEGTATAVELARPRGVAVDSSSNVYVADSDNNLIRSISGGNVASVAGNGSEGFSGDGGAATSAALDTPGAVATSGSTVLISDTGNNIVREVKGGKINSMAGGLPFGNLDSAVDAITHSTTVALARNLLVGGWAADPQDGAPVRQVQILIDGTVVGNATLGLPRHDVAAAYNNPAYLNSGWTFGYAALGLSLGTHTVTVIATDSLSRAATMNSKTITVQ